MQTFFSIVIPTLNEEEYLPKLLRCLKEQNFKDFEVVVVDGKSTDRTISIVKKFQKEFRRRHLPLTLVVSTKRGSANQRNLGAKKGRGMYLVFFDADITIADNYLKNLSSNLTRLDYPNNLVTSFVKPDKNGFLEWCVTIFTNLMIEFGRLIGKPLSPGFNTIVKKEVFLRVGGFDPQVNVTDDYDFSLRAASKGYHLKIIRSFQIHFSLRRFRSHGWSRTFFEYFQMAIYNFFKGPPKERVFDYSMGGNQHARDC